MFLIQMQQWLGAKSELLSTQMRTPPKIELVSFASRELRVADALQTIVDYKVAYERRFPRMFIEFLLLSVCEISDETPNLLLECFGTAVVEDLVNNLMSGDKNENSTPS